MIRNHPSACPRDIINRRSARDTRRSNKDIYRVSAHTLWSMSRREFNRIAGSGEYVTNPVVTTKIIVIPVVAADETILLGRRIPLHRSIHACVSKGVSIDECTVQLFFWQEPSGSLPDNHRGCLESTSSAYAEHAEDSLLDSQRWEVSRSSAYQLWVKWLEQ